MAKKWFNPQTKPREGWHRITNGKANEFGYGTLQQARQYALPGFRVCTPTAKELVAIQASLVPKFYLASRMGARGYAVRRTQLIKAMEVGRAPTQMELDFPADPAH